MVLILLTSSRPNFQNRNGIALRIWTSSSFFLCFPLPRNKLICVYSILHKWLTQGASVLSTEWDNTFYQVRWHILLFFVCKFWTDFLSPPKMNIFLGLWIIFDLALIEAEADDCLPRKKGIRWLKVRMLIKSSVCLHQRKNFSCNNLPDFLLWRSCLSKHGQWQRLQEGFVICILMRTHGNNHRLFQSLGLSEFRCTLDSGYCHIEKN